MDEQKLLETLRKVEALFAGTTFAGEREAAAEAIERIRAHVSVSQLIPPRYSMVASRTRFTARDIRCHCASSSPNCCRPLRVSE